ncbi:MAG TPA: hypothetical protein VE912_24115 [Bacteroidales bacterium]|nr:hypothetical protein [Bacteroidales bacterium]
MARISSGKKPQFPFKNPQYDKRVSKVISQNAIIEYENSHFEDYESLLDRLIAVNVAAEEDYMFKSMVMRKLYDSTDKLEKALSYLQKADILNVYPLIGIDKQKGLNYLQLGYNNKTIKAVNIYLGSFGQQKPSEYIESEIEWTRKPIYMIKNF